MLVWLKRFSRDPGVAKARVEFERAQKAEQRFHRDTIVECCRRRSMEPYAYLRDLLTRLPTLTNWQIKDVTLQAWAKAKTVAGLKVA